MKKYLIPALLIFCLIFFNSCKTKQTADRTITDKGGKKITQEQEIQNTALFLDGVREKELGNPDKAMGLFAQCIKQNPEADAAMYELAMLKYMDKKYSEALPLAKNAAKLKPDNKWYSLLLAETYIAQKDYSNAEKVYKIITEKNPDETEYFIDWADIYIMSGNYSEAVKVYNVVEKKQGIQPETSIQKQKLYLQMGKLSKAIEEMELLIAAFPKESQYLGMLAELYMSNSMPVKAYELYQRVIKINPDDPYVHLSLADYYRMQKETAKVIEELKLALSNKELDIDAKVKVLLSLMDLGPRMSEYKDALPELGRLVTESSPDEAKAFSVYGDILSNNKQYKEAREAYHQVVELDSSKYIIWQQLILLDSELNDNANLLSDSKKAMDLFPEQAEPYFFYGIAQLRSKNYKEAIRALNNGKSFVNNDDTLLLKYLSTLGDCYYKNQNYDLAFEAYEKSLSIDPNNAYVLNNYSYYLALQNQNLSRAQQLAERLNSQNPGVYMYQDTYAWVYYKQKDYTNAKKWVEKALAAGGDVDAGILDHYGDILYQNNETEKALTYWNKAKAAGMKTEILDKKITDKKLYE
ncbi:MAG: tetratricopeptide repeat protein [Bacteroidota bacterium]